MTSRSVRLNPHTTAEDAAEGLIDPILQAGNAAADHFAVAARKLASQQSPCHSFDAHYARARAWYRHITSGIAHWQQDAFGDAEAEAAEEDDQEEQLHLPQEAGERLEEAAVRCRKHSLWIRQGTFHCRACGHSFVASAKPELLAKRRCKGPLDARVFDSLSMQHELAGRYAYTSEEMHAAGAVPWRGVSGLPAVTAAGADPRLAEEEVRRRLVGKQPRPISYNRKVVTETIREAESGHILVTSGSLTFCDRCGRWAIRRLSRGLQRRCTGTVDTSLGAYRVRRERLRQGRHPLTGRRIV